MARESEGVDSAGGGKGGQDRRPAELVLTVGVVRPVRAEYKTVKAVNGPLVILEDVKVRSRRTPGQGWLAARSAG
eukprot:COSAG02_NODE_1180_length_14037_cov_73.962907_7_plen_75_part_00